MVKVRYTFFVILALLFTSTACKSKNTSKTDDNTPVAVESTLTAKAQPEKEEQEEVVLSATEPQPINTDDFEAKLYERTGEVTGVQQRLVIDLLRLDNSSVKALAAAQDVLKKYFKNATARQADSLYLVYHAYANLHLELVWDDEYYTQVIEHAYNHSFYASEENTPKVYQPILAQLDKVGIRVEDVGEGCAEFSFYPDYFLNIFEPHTTESTKVYLEIDAFEKDYPFIFDAAISISWTQLAERINTFATYAEKYPQSLFIQEVTETLRWYTNMLLTGLDNTSVFDFVSHSDGRLPKILPEVYEEYQQFITNNPNTYATYILQEFCMVLEKNDMMRTEEVDHFITNWTLPD